MLGLAKKISTGASHHTTYQIGLLQSRAYRILKQETARALEKYKMSPTEWSCLGLLYDNPKGLHASVVAEDLGVMAPFVTELAQDLKARKLIDVVTTTGDKRMRLIRITNTGIQFVTEVEPTVRLEMKQLIASLTRNDFLSYLVVLKTIVNYGAYTRREDLP